MPVAGCSVSVKSLTACHVPVVGCSDGVDSLTSCHVPVVQCDGSGCGDG